MKHLEAKVEGKAIFDTGNAKATLLRWRFRSLLLSIGCALSLSVFAGAKIQAQPVNDTRTTASIITGSQATITTTLEGCSTEQGEPNLPHGLVPSRSCWWKWSAKQDGTLAILQREFLRTSAIDSRWLIQVFALTGHAGTWKDLEEREGLPVEEGASTYQVAAGEDYLIRLADPDSIPVAATQQFQFDVQFSELIVELDPPGGIYLEQDPPAVVVRPSTSQKPVAEVTLRKITRNYANLGWFSSVQQRQPSLPARFPLQADRADVYRWGVVVSNLDGSLEYAHVKKLRLTPSNDDFANAKILPAFTTREFFFLHTATVEAGEPGILLSPTNHTTWYRWTAPGEGWVDVINANDPAVYVGDELSTLQPAPEIKPASIGTPLRFRSILGVTYSIQLRSAYPIDYEENHEINVFYLSYFPPVPGWLSTNRTAYRIGETISLGFVNGNSRSPLESAWVQVGDSTFPAPTTPPYVVSLNGFGPGHYSARLFGKLASGQVISNTPLAFIVSEPKGDPGQAEPLVGNSGSFIAGTQLGVPISEGSELANVYYQWQAPATGYLVLYTTNHVSVAPSVHLFDTPPDPLGPGLPSLAGDYDPFRGIIWPVSNRVSYLLRYQIGREFAPQPLNWLFTQRPANDMIRNAEPLTTPPFHVFGIGFLATRETNESLTISSSGRSLWWSWTPPASGVLDVSVTLTCNVALFENGELPNLKSIRLITPSPANARRYKVQKGKSILLRSDQSFGSFAWTSWSATFIEASPNAEWDQAFVLEGLTHQFPVPLLEKLDRDVNYPAPYPSRGLEPFPLWWKWIAPASGSASLIASPQGYADVSVLEGDRLETLVPTPLTSQPNGLVQFSTLISHAYYLKITPHHSLTSSPIVSLSMTTATPSPTLEIVPVPQKRSMLIHIQSLHERHATLQVSNNLSDWTPLQEVAPDQESFTLEIPFEGSSPQGTFFRVVIQP